MKFNRAYVSLFSTKICKCCIFVFSNNTKFLISQSRKVKGLNSSKETIDRGSMHRSLHTSPKLQSVFLCVPALWNYISAYIKHSSTTGIF